MSQPVDHHEPPRERPTPRRRHRIARPIPGQLSLDLEADAK